MDMDIQEKPDVGRYRQPHSGQPVKHEPMPPPAPVMPIVPRKNKKSKRSSSIIRYWRWAAVIVAAVLIILLVYGYIHTKNELVQLKKGQSAGSGSQSQQLLSVISKYLVLPSETPTVATVSDASKLQSQEFFKNAKNGDTVLIFPKAGRALLYRPSTHKIIEYEKVNL